MASGLDGAVGAGGTDSTGSSSYCACSAYAGTRDVGLGGAATGAE